MFGRIDEFAILMRIVRHERVQFLREIQYKQLFSITQKDMITGDSVIHLAVFEDKTDFVKKIISPDEGSHALYELEDINLKNEDGNTPLCYACLRGNLELVKLLHFKGALMAHRNTAGLTPLLLSIYH